MYDKTKPDEAAKGFREDFDKVLQKLGRRMKVMGLPDGNSAYVTAADRSPLVEFYRSSLTGEKIYLKEAGSLKKNSRWGIGSSDTDLNWTSLPRYEHQTIALSSANLSRGDVR